MSESAGAVTDRHFLLPPFLLRRFADGAGQVIMERRDRARRSLVSVETAVAECGAFEAASGADAPALAGLLVRCEAGAEAAVARILAGTFPPAGEDRAYLAAFVALRLLLGRAHREGLGEMAEVLGSLIVAKLEQTGEDVDSLETGPEPAPDVLVHDAETTTRGALAGWPRLARALSGRTWQLVRFPGRPLLTAETPVAVWRKPGSTERPTALGDEVRMPLDPSHGLVMARVARLGEVVRDLEAPHARALNRTMAETARRWMVYHPEGDPLDAVELAHP